MSGRFITYVIIGAAFGFTQIWFVYWVVRLFKEKQRILAARRAAVAPRLPSSRAGTPSAASGTDAGASPQRGSAPVGGA